MAQGPADDATQHIAPALVTGHHPVRDQKGGRPDVVRDHPKRRQLAGIGGVSARGLGGGGDERLEKINLVIAMHALEHRGDALEAHARIDARARKGRHGAVGAALELHKHQIPNFDIAIAVFLRRARGTTPHLGAMVVEDFRAGTTGPVSPMDQKLSLSPMRVMRSAGTPISSRQICSASSSLSWTVTQSFSAGRPKRSVSNVQAKRIASRLK